MSVIDKLTIEEKIALVSGTDFFYTNPIPRLQIKSFAMSDGPHGLRYQKENSGMGLSKSYPATSFPTAVTLASSWNVHNLRLVGQAIADECKHYGVGLLLGPGVNIKRNPLCGRSFEYFSEDPLLTAKLAINEIKGLQDNNVGSTVKHFALNNSENYRFMSNSIADNRAMREIYLRQFEMIVKEANPAAIMTSYNKINGSYGSENTQLIANLLRKEWNYNGLVMTDWGGIHNRANSLNAGLDLEMPGDTRVCRKNIMDSISSGMISIDNLDESVIRVLELINKYDNEKIDASFESHHNLAREIACDSAVLLENKNNTLPLNKNEKILVLGELFEEMRYQGSGSSMIEPTFITTPKNAFNESNIQYEYRAGYSKDDINNDLIAEAIEACKSYDKILLFIGLTDQYETEGNDRSDLLLPKNQLELINELKNINKKIIAVLFSGSVVDLSLLDSASAILYMGLPGQNGGNAVVDLLFGDKSPSGRLAETWVNSYSDVPFNDEYSRNNIEIYKESIYVGYRYYTTFNIPVRYPFGYGLSYSKFEYNNLRAIVKDDYIEITVDVKNIGLMKASEVVQVYVEHESKIFSPRRELKAFDKITLEPNQVNTISLIIKIEDLKYYNIANNKFILDGGIYIIQICKNVNEVILSQNIELQGQAAVMPYSEEVNSSYSSFNITNEIFEKMSGIKIPEEPPKKPITMDSRFTDFKYTLPGRLIYKAVMTLPNKDRKKALKIVNPIERDNRLKASEFLRYSLESNSLNGMTMCSSGKMHYNQAEALMHFANYRFIKGIISLCRGIKAPKLPKEEK